MLVAVAMRAILILWIVQFSNRETRNGNARHRTGMRMNDATKGPKDVTPTINWNMGQAAEL
jgi:hypothetical protein